MGLGERPGQYVGSWVWRDAGTLLVHGSGRVAGTVLVHGSGWEEMLRMMVHGSGRVVRAVFIHGSGRLAGTLLVHGSGRVVGTVGWFMGLEERLVQWVGLWI